MLKVLYFDPDHRENGAVIVPEEDSWGKCNSSVSSILLPTKELFEHYFGKEVVNRQSIIVLHENDEKNQPNPICFPWLSVIMLTADGDVWNQLIYQFAHEMCHLMINTTVEQQFRWFEETICQVSSLFFLEETYHQWLGKKYTYAPNFLNYQKREIDKKNQTIYSNFTISDLVREKLPHLQKECEDRDINGYVANGLLPIFEEFPELWRYLPDWNKVKGTNSLSEFLDMWATVSNGNISTPINQMKKLLFGVS